ncbi:MAG: hypothetical protein ACXVJD_11015 [Mucilaginibacter sp.]
MAFRLLRNDGWRGVAGWHSDKQGGYLSGGVPICIGMMGGGSGGEWRVVAEVADSGGGGG